MGRVGRRLEALRSAARNAGEIIRKGRLGAPWHAPFDVVEHGRNHVLRRFQTEPDGAFHGVVEPLILIPPLMVTADVYDISPELSPVLMLAGMGFDVWLVDFGIPEEADGGMSRTLDDHILAIDGAVDTVRAATGRDVHLAGYSQGGMFCYQAAAYRRAEGVSSVITFASPVQLHRNLPVPVADPLIERALRLLRAGIDGPLDDLAGLPGTITSTGFKVFAARKELKQIAGFLRALPDRDALEKREPTRRFLGGEGFVAWPGPAFKDFVDQVVVGNRMARGGMVIGGRTCALADITCPILYFVGLRDEMARPASVRGIRAAAPKAEAHEVQVPAGHFGVVVGSRALSVTWPTVAEWVAWRSGVGERPERLDQASDAEAEEAVGDAQGLYELSVDMLDRVWDRAGDAGVQAGGLFHALRWELPRMARLESIGDRSRVGLSRALSAQVEALPDQTFFLWRGRAYTWAQADARVNQAAGALAARGVGPGTRVVVEVEEGPDPIAVLTALNRLGAVAVIEGEGEIGVGGDGVPLASLFEGSLQPYAPDPGRAEDLAMILRGRALSNRRWATVALVAAAGCQLTPRDTLYCPLPLSHPTAMLVAGGGALVGGCRLALAEEGEDVWVRIRRVGATVVFYDRDLARALVDAPPARNEQQHPVRMFVGSGIEPEVHRRLVDRFGAKVQEFHAAALGSVVFVNLEGQKPGSIGRRFPGSARVALVRVAEDAVKRNRAGRCILAAPHEPGHLLVAVDGGQALSLRGAEDPGGVLVRDCFTSGDTWLDTGERLIRDPDGDWWRA